jgi:hypothetical protein
MLEKPLSDALIGSLYALTPTLLLILALGIQSVEFAFLFLAGETIEYGSNSFKILAFSAMAGYPLAYFIDFVAGDNHEDVNRLYAVRMLARISWGYLLCVPSVSLHEIQLW